MPRSSGSLVTAGLFDETKPGSMPMPPVDDDTFSIRYGFWKPLLVVLGMGPSRSWTKIDGPVVHVQMGWAFQARIDRTSIVRASAGTDKRSGIGVHGWRGKWLVNGSISGIVTMEIEPPAPARAVGYPIKLRTLHVSLDDPGGFLRRLGI